MDRELGKEYEIRKRSEFLRDNCDSMEEKSYLKRFTPEQLLQMKDKLSETAIQINDIEEEKKVVVAEFKKKIDPLNDEKKRLLTGLKNKAETITENVFKFVDLKEREVGYYNAEGELIESRPAYADELQSNIFQMQRTGTHN